MRKKKTCKQVKRDFELKILKANPRAVSLCLEDLGISKADIKKMTSEKAQSRLISKVTSCMRKKELQIWFKAAWIKSVLKSCPSIKSDLLP